MHRFLPILTPPRPPKAPLFSSPELISELQALGVRWIDASGPGLSRRGGAGPSDHKAITIGRQTVMVPIFTHASEASPYAAEVNSLGDGATLFRDGEPLLELGFARLPRFYARSTPEGVPYWKIATLHADDVLATTLLQTCIRYGNRETACQFCAIGQSLARKTTIAEKSPHDLAEVVKAAVELDGVRHVVLTTGTPHTPDRGAQVLAAAAAAIRSAIEIPIQAQCEPPNDPIWFSRLFAAGVVSLGMHLEAVTESVRARIMPGKAEVPLSAYFAAFERAVAVFGRAQVSTYILAGLGDSREAILETCEQLIRIGVYPFVVPFVPIAGTPLADHPPPTAAFIDAVLGPLSELLRKNGIKSSDIKAGCGRCGACSSLRARESERNHA